MKTAILFMIVFITMIASTARAQQPSNSFSALAQMLKKNQELIVRDTAGRATQGFFVSITDEEIIVTPEGYHDGDRRFAKNDVRRIDMMDSAWNGALIGAGVGTAVLLGFKNCNDYGGGECLVFGWFARAGPAFGMLIGYGLDRMINNTVYEREPRIAVIPLLARERVGANVRVTF